MVEPLKVGKGGRNQAPNRKDRTPFLRGLDMATPALQCATKSTQQAWASLRVGNPAFPLVWQRNLALGGSQILDSQIQHLLQGENSILRYFADLYG